MENFSGSPVWILAFVGGGGTSTVYYAQIIDGEPNDTSDPIGVTGFEKNNPGYPDWTNQSITATTEE